MELGFISMIVGQKLVTDTISTTTSSIYSLLGAPALNNASLQQYFIELDIQSKCECIEAIYQEIDKNMPNNTSDAIKCCLDSVHQMVLSIHEILHKIQTKVEEHPQKWFHKFRSYDITSELQRLTSYVKALDGRTDLLCKTIRLFQK